jgi:hypothetical protein
MTQAIVDITEEANNILNIVKARYSLRNKSEAINEVTLRYGAELLEPELRPEFIRRMQARVTEPTTRFESIKDFEKYFNL